MKPTYTAMKLPDLHHPKEHTDKDRLSWNGQECVICGGAELLSPPRYLKYGAGMSSTWEKMQPIWLNCGSYVLAPSQTQQLLVESLSLLLSDVHIHKLSSSQESCVSLESFGTEPQTWHNCGHNIAIMCARNTNFWPRSRYNVHTKY